KDDRAVRIEVGYGLEGALPDVIANRIIEQVIAPRFREGDYYGGVVAALERIMAIIEGEPLPETLRRPQERGAEDVGAALPVFLMLLFVVSGVLRRIFGTLGGAAFAGGAAGVLVWLLTSALGMAIGAAIIAVLFTVFSGAGGGRGWSSRRRGHDRGGLGGWRGGGGLGGRGGGGGGSHGGGGAAGRGWMGAGARGGRAQRRPGRREQARERRARAAAAVRQRLGAAPCIGRCDGRGSGAGDRGVRAHTRRRDLLRRRGQSQRR